jgi:hypothetical protein
MQKQKEVKEREFFKNTLNGFKSTRVILNSAVASNKAHVLSFFLLFASFASSSLLFFHRHYIRTTNDLFLYRTTLNDEQTVTIPFSVPLIFCLPRLTFTFCIVPLFFNFKIGHNDDDDNDYDDDANDDSTTALYRPKRLFLKFSNVKNMGKPLNFFSSITHLVHCRFSRHCTTEMHYPFLLSMCQLLLILLEPQTRFSLFIPEALL